MLKFKRNKSIFGILGNKENDIKYFFEYLPWDKNIIVEAFGGSYSVIRCVYYDDKYIKVVNASVVLKHCAFSD